MTNGLQELADTAERLDPSRGVIRTHPSTVPTRLRELYAIGDGFLCFRRSLLVRPISRDGEPEGVVQWQQHALWDTYFEAGEDYFLFAEDAFGDQFYLSGAGILRLDMETGERTFLAESVGEWSRMITSDPVLHLGFGFMSDWVETYGTVALGFRLAPKIPFVLGGDYSIENMSVVEEVQLCLFRSQLASQIKNLPDGTKIAIDFEN